MAEAVQKRLQHRDYRVAIICPLEVEMSAMRYMLDEEHAKLPSKDGDRNRYIFGELSGHNVVIAFLPQGTVGVGAATRVATDMKWTFPKILLRLLVGIGGGVPGPEKDIRLGDVVIGMPADDHGGVVQYDLGRETTSSFERTGFLEPPPIEWRNAVVEMQSDHRIHSNRIGEYLSKMFEKYPGLRDYRTPPQQTDILFLPESIHLPDQRTCQECDHTQIIERVARQNKTPTIFYGLIASGNRVQKNAKARDQISQDAGGALCFEMEAAGLMNDFHCVVIRGIADYSDSHKNKHWQPYGAASAAGTAKELLTYMAPLVETQSASYSTIPKGRVNDFMGRQEELDQIGSFFSDNVTNQPRTLILQALGGQGKSQIALEYCHQALCVDQDLFWINASSESTATQSYVSIAQELDDPALRHLQDSDKVKHVRQILEHWEQRWLMVFDNFDDPKTFSNVRDFIPIAGKGDILFTSRYGGLERLGKVLEIPPLPTKTGVELLLRHFWNPPIHEHVPEASRIVERLGGLPLAIDQAASYIKYCHMQVSEIGQFLGIYEEQRQKILEYVPEDFWEYGMMRTEASAKERAVSAFTTWEMSFKQLCSTEPERQKAVAHLLKISAFLAAIPIREELIINYWARSDTEPWWLHDYGDEKSTASADCGEIFTCWNHEKFWDTIFKAKTLSLLNNVHHGQISRGSTFSLHLLIRDWLQLRENPQQRKVFTLESAEILAASIQAKKFSTLNLGEKQDLLLHMDAILWNDKEFSLAGNRLGENIGTCDIARQFADFFTFCGRYSIAEELLSSVLNTRLNVTSDEDEVILEIIASLSEAKLNLGKPEDAEQICHKQLHRTHKPSRKGRVLMVRIKRNLGSALVYQGKIDAAEKVLREALYMADSMFGAENYESLIIKRNLATDVLIKRTDKLEETELILREILEVARRRFGKRSQYTVGCVHDLGRVLTWPSIEDHFKLDEGHQLLREALSIRRKLYGREHPSTLACMGDMGRYLMHDQVRRFQEAEEVLREMLEMRERVLGKEHPQTKWALWCLGACQQRMNQSLSTEAEQNLQKPARNESDIHGFSSTNA
ncbi:MAG: hypothetical protein Q9227_006070 [Pyrenula ochraceoflavens]